MDSTLDFFSRARLAWKQFRNPGGIDAQRTAEEGATHEQEAARRESAWPRIAVENPSEHTALDQFRLLVGIYQHKTFQATHGFTINRRPQASLHSRPSPNMGIYTAVCDAEIKCKRNHKSFSRLLSGCLGLQLIVAAALTALGAANGSRSAVTVFGAINTVIAGFLTYFKGSGLPGRLKYYQSEWTKVREYIEQRERDFILDSHGLNPYEEVDKVRQMYEAVKADIEHNRPDRYVSNSGLGQQPATRPAGPTLTRPQPSFSTESFRKGWLEKEKEAGVAVNKAQGTANNLFSNMAHLKDAFDSKVKEIGHMEKEIESQGHKMAEEKKHGLLAEVQAAVKEVAHLGKEIEAKAKAAASETVAEKQHDAEDAINRGSEVVRAGVGQQRDNATAAITDAQHGVDDALAKTSDSARAALQQQKDNLNAALSEKDDSVPPRPGLS